MPTATTPSSLTPAPACIGYREKTQPNPGRKPHHLPMRIKPSVGVGVGIWALYAAVVVGIQKTSGIAYDEWGDTAANLWRTAVLSLAAGAVLLIVAATWLGWWRQSLRDDHRVRIAWTLIAPAIYVVIVINNLVVTDWGTLGTDFLLAAIALGVLVGFSEELLCRGLLLVGLRGRLREVAVWALTCLMFGVIHGLNILLGQPVGSTMQQVVVAGGQGSAFYILRRYFGTLVLAMALHGLWDASIFMHETSGGEVAIAGILVWPAVLLSLIGGFIVARRTQQGPVEDYAVGSTAAAVPSSA